MSLEIVELFGYAPSDKTSKAASFRARSECPFVGGTCIKRFKSGLISGACTLQTASSGPVICCPNRLYAEKYHILLDVAVDAFGDDVRLCRDPSDAKEDGRDVMVFGRRWGKELRLPSRRQSGGYFVDWILARVSRVHQLEEFVALEVQTMDTTGSYEAQVRKYLGEKPREPEKGSGINWENVSKRILPQIIFKGHVLRQEQLCKKGMYFICPLPVHERIKNRLGGSLRPYHPQSGALTFRTYDIGDAVRNGFRRSLELKSQMTTTVDQVALAFTAPSNLPSPGVYEKAIRDSLACRYNEPDTKSR